MRVLTKSRFKLGLECPNKLYYTKKDEYVDKKKEDSFLMALAEGGFQVEELARLHYPDGHLIEDGDHKEYNYMDLWHRTQELLKQDNVIIYEAAFLIDGLFIRTDVLVKMGNYVKLIEVKSKSFDPKDDYIFVGKRGGIVSTWKPYLMDVAFQKYVMSQCYPHWKIDSYIMMADKTKNATIDGLNQLFRLSKGANNRTGVKVLQRDISLLGESVLGTKNITNVVTDILEGRHLVLNSMPFLDALDYLKTNYLSDTYANHETSYKACKSCEFKATKTQLSEGLRSGYHECFTKKKGWSDLHFDKSNTFDIWHFTCGNALFSKGLVFKDELTEDDIKHKPVDDVISRTDRQWIQIQKDITNDNTPHILVEQLKEQIDSWKYPLNFIDFETNTVALPFHKGRKPYESIAFQYSHHILYEDGRIEHASEYINDTAGEFPNFDFVRHLRKDLSSNDGSIFRYSPHENTILNAIYIQLMDSDEVDKLELMKFIEQITHSKRDSTIKWTGERDMIDQWDIIKKYYYNPLTKGSNSLKFVLPAILSSDTSIQTKYGKPIKEINLTSKNFSTDHIWLHKENGEVINPYKMLKPLFDNWTSEQIEQTISDLKAVGDGGAAMIAYAKLQYADMDIEERVEISEALLRYCELDTLAMVMVHEHFMNVTSLK